jgi:N-acetyl-gamma-glutamyl-phosphate reductase
LSVKPLLDVKLANNKFGIITSTTWYSWWGKKMIEEFEKGKNKQSFQYSTWIEHKHEAEIKNETWLIDFIFQPEVVNYFNWLKVNVFLNLTSKWKKLSEEDFIELFNNYYNGEKNIKVSSMPNDWEISMSENNETQKVSIYIKKYSTKIQIVTVIDNMMKWAAWAAIQNLNIMLWFDEGIGLE